MKVISALWMKHFEMVERLQLKKAGKYFGKIGLPLLDLWEWSLGYRMPRTSSELGASQYLQLAYDRAAMVEETSCNWHSLWGALGRWHDGRFGL